jgi:hypothetical protein
MLTSFSRTSVSSLRRSTSAPAASRGGRPLYEALEQRRLLAASPGNSQAVDDSLAPAAAAAVTAAAAVAPSAAVVSGVDPTTAGTWRGVYGAKGAVIAGNTRSLPSYAAFSTGATLKTWSTSTTERRALEKIAGGTTRVAAAWTHRQRFDVQLDLTDAQMHRVSLYMLDWERAGRAQRVEVLNSSTKKVLATQDVSGFGNGKYIAFDVTGKVTIRFTATAGPGAALSGLFIDALPPKFPVVDGTLFVSKPDLEAQGFGEGYQLNPLVWTDEASVRAYTRNLAQAGAGAIAGKVQVIYLDEIPGWQDTYFPGTPECEAAIQRMIQILDWVKAEAPSVKVGLYYAYDYWSLMGHLMQLRKGHSTELSEPNFLAWHAAADNLRNKMGSHVDYVFPSLYRFAGENYPLEDWKMYAKAVLDECGLWGKPVLPFLWPEYHDDGNPAQAGIPVPAAEWRQLLEFSRDNGADGVVIWGGWGPNGNITFDRNADWYLQTVDFMRQTEALLG